MVRAAILDDYQNVALQCADWSPITKDVDVKVFNDPIGGPEAVIKALQGFAVIVMMRERTPFPRKVYQVAAADCVSQSEVAAGRASEAQLTAAHRAAVPLQAVSSVDARDALP